MQVRGKNVPKDPAMGHERLERACFRNDHLACRWLSEVERTEGRWAEALVAAQRGCDLGDAASCRKLERLHAKMRP